MSILINGMKMPKGHPVCIVIDAAGQARRYDLDNNRYADDELFEAVPVPPHGDLVERKAVLNTFSTHMNRTRHYVTIRDNVPTIIPAEEGET